MRKMIKRLLKKYKYPPEEAANALETVIRQCEQWTDNDDSEPLYQKAPKKYEFPESSSYTIAAEPNSKYNNLSEKTMSNKSIIIPVNNKPTKIESVQNFVIVGANGSGKSHLGAWIEQQSANGEVLRISAQRALSIPDSITIKSEEAAWNKIYYGEELHHDKNYKWNWGNGLTTKLIDDYDSVLSAIFARLNKEDRAYVIDCKDKEKEVKRKPMFHK